MRNLRPLYVPLCHSITMRTGRRLRWSSLELNWIIARHPTKTVDTIQPSWSLEVMLDYRNMHDQVVLVWAVRWPSAVTHEA